MIQDYDVAPDDMCRECDGQGWFNNQYDEMEDCRHCDGLGFVSSQNKIKIMAAIDWGFPVTPIVLLDENGRVVKGE